MADELKKDEKSTFNEFDDSTEPIESIQKTVEDLKRKIQELSTEEEKTTTEETSKKEDEQFKIPDFIAPHAETLQQMKDTTVKTLHTVKEEVVDKTKKAASVVKEKAEKLNENEEIRKTLDYIKKNATKAYDTAMIKLDELKQDPKVKDVSDKASDAYQKAKDYIVPKTKELTNVIKDTTQKTFTKVNDFVSRPDVPKKDTIQKVKDTTKQAVDKGIETVRNIIQL